MNAEWSRAEYSWLMSCWELAWHMAGYKQCACPTLIDNTISFPKWFHSVLCFKEQRRVDRGLTTRTTTTSKNKQERVPDMCSV